MTGINLQSYSILSTYAILSQTGITTVDTTIVNNGYYGNAGGPAQITGTYTPSGSPSGMNNTNVPAANIELNTLISDINTYTSGLSQSLTSGGTNVTITFFPNISYYSLSTIIFDTNTVINFDAQGNSNSQFFITAGSTITFTTITMNLLNGAQACNIFWLANTTITFTTVPVIYGNLIAQTAAITFTTTPTIDGHIYTRGTNVTFSGSTEVNAVNCSAVCYVKGTFILTETGYVAIENLKLNDKVVTNGKIHKSHYIEPEEQPTLAPIIWLGKFKVRNLTDKTRPICIKKNVSDGMFPFEDLYVSPEHSILVDGKMVLVKYLVNGKTIFQDYHREYVEYYHLELETHSAIIANGILSESYLDSNNRNIFEDIDT